MTLGYYIAPKMQMWKRHRHHRGGMALSIHSLRSKNTRVDGMQTGSNGLVYDVCTLRRKRLDLEMYAL
jgi:hypothetical protein